MGNRKVQLMLFRALVLGSGTLLALLFSMAFVPKITSVLRGTAPELSAGSKWEGQIMVAMFVIFMLGYLAGWFRPVWGGMSDHFAYSRVQQTVRPVTSVAGQRPRPAVPQLTPERWASQLRCAGLP